MPNFKSISFKMAMLQGAGRICLPHVCVIQKTPCGIGFIGLVNSPWKTLCFSYLRTENIICVDKILSNIQNVFIISL